MKFKKILLKKLSDSGKEICIKSKNISKLLKSYPSNYFKEYSLRTYYFWTNGNRGIPLNIAIKIMNKYKISYIEIENISISGGNKITFPDEKNIRFNYILGLILGDGCLVNSKRAANKSTYSIQICFRKKKDAERIKEYCKELFSIEGSIYKGRGCYGLYIYSKPIVLILNKKYEIPIGLKYEKIKIPSIIQNSKNKKIIKAFIKGVFDSDGNIYNHHKTKCVQLRQKSKTFLEEIRLLLKELRIEFNNIYYDKANNSWLLWSSKKKLVDNFINQITDFRIMAP